MNHEIWMKGLSQAMQNAETLHSIGINMETRTNGHYDLYNEHVETPKLNTLCLHHCS